MRKPKGKLLTFMWCQLCCPQGDDIKKIKAYSYEEAIIKVLQEELKDLIKSRSKGDDNSEESEIFFKVFDVYSESAERIINATDEKSERCLDAFFTKNVPNYKSENIFIKKANEPAEV